MEQQVSKDNLSRVAPRLSAKLSHLALDGRLYKKRFISGGGYGDVFKGEYEYNKQGTIKKDEVVIKRLRVSLGEGIEKIFEKEMYVWSKLEHRNILPFLGFGFDYETEHPLLVSPWMKNGSAWLYVKKQPSADVIMRLIQGTAHGLAYLHEKDVIHTDIKSDNVLVSDSGEALICDFGCSRIINASLSLAEPTPRTKGTYIYLARESVWKPGNPEAQNKQTDIWAFAMTVFELSTQTRPYTNQTQMVIDLGKDILPHFPQGPLADFSEEETHTLDRLCKSCWDSDPSKRPAMANIVSVLEALKEDVQRSRNSPESCSKDSAARLHPLNYVLPEILDQLAHLRLSGRLDFKKGGLLAGGGYGDVYTASCAVEGQGTVKVAVKRLRLFPGNEIRMLFERELYVWSKLQHENILPLFGYDFDDETGFPLLVSEWMVKGSTWQYINNNFEADVVHLLLGISRGLAYLHQQGIVHSDIKSDNVLVSNSGEARICDFGCSRIIAASRSLANITSGIKGTLRYLAPELLMSNPAGHTVQTDVWAFGMTTFELLTRTRPYTGMQDVWVVQALLNLQLPSFPHDIPGKSLSEVKTLKALCHLCWKSEAATRISMQGVMAVLEVQLIASQAE